MATLFDELRNTSLLLEKLASVRAVRPELRLDPGVLFEQKITLIQLLNSPHVDEFQEHALIGLLSLIDEILQDQEVDEEECMFPCSIRYD